jgi:hypothetical protein
MRCLCARLSNPALIVERCDDNGRLKGELTGRLLKSLDRAVGGVADTSWLTLEGTR